MYALVRFVEGSLNDTSLVIDTKDIKKFDCKSINFNKKYKVKYSDQQLYKAVILYVNENKDELLMIQNTKRLKQPRKEYLESDSDSDVTVKQKMAKRTDLRKSTLKIISNKKLESDIMEQFEENNQIPIDDNNSDDETNGKNNNEIDDKSDDMTANKADHKIDDTTDDTFEVTIKSLKKENLELKQKVKELETINTSLQRDVIDSQKSLEKAFKNMNMNNVAVANKAVDKGNNAKIGEAVGNEVHIGQGIFISRHQYDAAFFHSKSGGQFVKSIASAVFTIEELKTHSVTGKQSNRVKKEVVKPPLNPTKLNAITDIYKHYLVQKGTDEILLGPELKKIGLYISNKISDLLRDPKRKKPTEQTDKEAEEIINDEPPTPTD